MTQRWAPPWLTQIQFIKTYYLSGCQQPLMVYIELAQPIAIETAIVFTTLSVDQIVKEMFRPHTIRSARHARTGRRNRRIRGPVPDVDEMTANRLRTDLGIQRAKYTLPTAVVYEITDIIDRLNYTLMLVELSTDIVYKTLIGVIENDPAACPNIRRLRRSSGFMTEGTGPPNWTNFNQSIEHYKVGIISDSGFTARLPAGKFNVTWAASALSASKPTITGWRLCTLNVNPTIFAQVLDLQLNTETPVDMIMNVNIDGPVQFTWQVISDDGFWFSLESDLVITEVL